MLFRSGKYIATNVSITSGATEGANVKIENNVIKIQVPNKKIEGAYQIQLEKVDSDDNTIKLEGAEFSYTLPNTTSVTMKTTDRNGILNLGTVDIIDVNQTDEITIIETKAPEGYKSLINNITVQVTKAVSQGKYIATNASITSGATEGTNVKIENDIIKIQVPNKKIEGNYQIQLEKVDADDNTIKLSNAKFNYKLPNQEEAIGFTDENGVLNLGTVKITEVNATDIIQITEKTAPEGYSPLIDKISLQITKGNSNGNYVVTKAEIVSGELEGMNVRIDGNRIKITVPNKKMTGSYEVQLEKVNSEDTTVKLSGAEFRYRLPNSNEEKVAITDNTGSIDRKSVV